MSCLRLLYLGFIGDAGRWGLVDMHHAHRVDSVALVRLSVALAVKHMPEMTATVVAAGLIRPSMATDANVTQIFSPVALVVGVPAAVREFGRRSIERKITSPTCKITMIWERAAIFTNARHFCAAQSQHAILVSRKVFAPLHLSPCERVISPHRR